MTCRKLITIPENLVVLFHHSYWDEGFELAVVKCHHCNSFHYFLQTFELTKEITEDPREEETFEQLLQRLYIDSKNVTDKVNWHSYQEFKVTHLVS